LGEIVGANTKFFLWLAAFLSTFFLLGAGEKDGLFGQTFAAWIQAIGSIAAIAATGITFVMDKRHERAQAEKAANALAFTAREMALNAIVMVSARLDAALHDQILFRLRGHQTTEIVQTMRELDIRALDPKIVRHFAVVRSSIFAVNSRITDVYASDEKIRRAKKQASESYKPNYDERRERLKSAARVLQEARAYIHHLEISGNLEITGIQFSTRVEDLVEKALAEEVSSTAAHDD
jgi:hypothetical protein